jgi:putative endonuclease
LYTGITKDVAQRVAAHNAKRGGKYTRSRVPVVLVLKHRFKDHRLAAQAEVRIKQLKKPERERLVKDGWTYR